jgi:branched-chain amino acid transport system permease protein
MGNLPGVIIGSLLVYFVNYYVLFAIPSWGVSLANLIGLGFLVPGNPSRNWPGLHDELALMQFLIFGIILVAMMLLRPQGLIPSRVRAQELKHAASEESVFDARVEAKEA